MGEYAGEKRGRMMGLQPRRLVRRQRKRSRVGLAETKRGEGPQHIPHLFDDVEVIALITRGGIKPNTDVVLGVQRSEVTAYLIGLRQRTTRHDRDHLQHLLVKDHDSMGFLEHRPQVFVYVHRCGPALA